MPYNFVADIFHTKKLSSGLSSSKVRFYMENGRFAFLSPPLEALGAMYDNHLRLIGKLVVDFLSVTWTFFARCYGSGATSDYRFKIGDFTPTGAGWPKIPGRRGCPHQTFIFSDNWAIWSFVWYKNLDRSLFRFVTIHAFDRRIDRQTDGWTDSFLLTRPPCIQCSAVEIKERWNTHKGEKRIVQKNAIARRDRQSYQKPLKLITTVPNVCSLLANNDKNAKKTVTAYR